MTADPFFLVIAPFFIILTVLVIVLFLTVFHFLKNLDKSGGYSILVEQWPASQEPSGTVFSHQNVGVGKIWYKNCVKMVISWEGLFIALGFPFRLGFLIHSESGTNALIPWGSVQFRQKSSAFWTEVYEYEIQSEKPVILTVSKQIAHSFPEYLKPPT